MTDHPFVEQWNDDSRHYPLVAEAISRCHRVIDLGCGEGVLSRYLASLGHEVIGIDSDPSIIASDEENCHFLLADATNLPFGPASCDAVVSVNAIHHTSIRHVLAEGRRLLAPGGKIVIIDRYAAKNPLDWWRIPLSYVESFASSFSKRRWMSSARTCRPSLGYGQTKEEVEQILPGGIWRRLPNVRYLVGGEREG